MMDRKKKLRLIQAALLLIGLSIIYFTYLKKQNPSEIEIVSKQNLEKFDKIIKDEKSGDVFYNIEYSGFDVSGNRYILKSKEAVNDKANSKIVKMKFVEAIFYFKDDTVLNVVSDKGIYNNETLDMSFKGNVKALYKDSQLFAQKAEYSNSKSYLIISEKVKVKDIRGTMFADELLFDIKKQTLNIASFKDEKINANINLK